MVGVVKLAQYFLIKFGDGLLASGARGIVVGDEALLAHQVVVFKSELGTIELLKTNLADEVLFVIKLIKLFQIQTLLGALVDFF